MEFTIEELTYFRDGTNNYTIYDTDGDIHLILGTYYRRVVSGPLYDSIIAFIKGDRLWKHALSNIERSLHSDVKEERDLWTYMTKDKFNKVTIDTEELYLDGFKKELNLVKKLL